MSKHPDLDSLLTLVSSHQSLITQYLSILTPPTTLSNTTTPQLPPNPPNPLHVLSDAATLLKAHTTKLSLLLLNKPFTPTAIQKVLRDIAGTCLPAIMSAVQICQPDIWGAFLKQQVVARVRAVLREMEVCYDEVKKVANEEVGQKTTTTKKGDKTEGRDSLVSTGLVWGACDKIVELKTLGIAGLAVKRAEEWRDMLRDAIEELKEWEEGDGDEDDDNDDAGSDDDDDDDDDDFEHMFGAANSIPTDRPDLKERLTCATHNLKKIELLYAALSKRRLKTFTPAVSSLQKNVARLDKILAILKELPESVDELASAFYDLDTEQIDKATQTTVDLAKKAVSLANTNWDGQEDEFTVWSTKWLDIIK